MTQPVEQQRVALDLGRDMDRGMGPDEAAEHGGQPRLGEILVHAEAHRAGDRAAPDRGQGLVIELEDAPGIAEHDVAGLGQRQAAALLPEQLLADLILKSAHLQADRRLSPPEPLGGAGEAAQIHRYRQGAEHVHVQIRQGHR